MAPFSDWLQTIIQAVRSKDAQTLAECINAQNSDARTVAFSNTLTPAQLENQVADRFRRAKIKNEDKWALFLSNHLEAVQSSLRQRSQDAYNSYTSAIDALRKVFTDVTQSWIDPMCIVAVRTYYRLARLAHVVASQAGASEVLKGASAQLRKFNSEVNMHFRDVNEEEKKSKVQVSMATIIVLYKFYFATGQVFQMDGIEPAALTANLSACTIADLCAYRFFKGAILVMEEKWEAAEASLSEALRICHPSSPKNRTAILSYLVPVRLVRGVMPRAGVLQREHLAYFEPIVEALKKGNPIELSQRLEEQQLRFMKAGTYLVMEKLHVLAFRMMLKRIYQCLLELGGTEGRVPLLAVQDTFRVLGREMHIDEVECIVANLIAKKMVKGYVAHKQQMVVLMKGPITKPFPPLSNAEVQKRL